MYAVFLYATVYGVLYATVYGDVYATVYGDVKDAALFIIVSQQGVAP